VLFLPQLFTVNAVNLQLICILLYLTLYSYWQYILYQCLVVPDLPHQLCSPEYYLHSLGDFILHTVPLSV
jgi:hypothetical protein